MPDIIRILPDSVANQIAAGEVIQRPASVVKELLENSIDATANEIEVIIKDAGKTLIQISDNGFGMTETDARLCFERHSTSKIKDSKDLFGIKTMGFRGEALASIAAISQVELKTKREDDTLGTKITIEGTKVKSQEECSCATGTTFSVKNLFYNVPARRNFLKSDQVETNHIIEEFNRVAIAFPETEFLFYHNDKKLYHLQGKTTLKQRISAIFGKHYNEKLIPVEQNTNYVKIYGFIGKPELAKKHRGEQYFFVNKRFIKNSYLNHSVINAFFELIPAATYPSYFIFIETEPKYIDINIHPTKTEIKFTDEKMIYAVLFSAVKQSLGKYNVTPTIDFEVERTFDLPNSYKDKIPKHPQIKINPNYNPFDKPKKNSDNLTANWEKKETAFEKDNKENWEKLYGDFPEHKDEPTQQIINPEWDNTTSLLANRNIIQVNNKYIITKLKTGILIVDQYKASERIYYEQFMNIIENNSFEIQQQLFPQQIELSNADSEILKNIKTDMGIIGFDINEFGTNSFIINGIPANIKIQNIQEFVEGCIETYKTGQDIMESDKKTNLALSMAKNIAKKSQEYLSEEEMLDLIDKLFACKIPDITPKGKKIYTIIKFDEIENRMK